MFGKLAAALIIGAAALPAGAATPAPRQAQFDSADGTRLGQAFR